MFGLRFAGVVLLSVSTAAYAPLVLYASADDVVETTADHAPLFRVFLTDGFSLVSYGEVARVADRVVFSMLTSASVDNPELQLVDIASSRVDWRRTEAYAESARATHYFHGRAASDYAMLSTTIAQALNDVGLTTDPAERLLVVQRARKTLADWPATHYNYKREELRQMLGMLDEAIAELRAAIGADRFDLALVATPASLATPPDVLLPAPTIQEVIDQTLAVARLTDSPSSRLSLLSVAIAAIDRHRAELPIEWAAATRASAMLTLSAEMAIDHFYQALSVQMVGVATRRARAADVRGVAQVLTLLRARDTALGSARPDTVNAIAAEIEQQLDAARRLRLERDRWALRLPELRQYQTSVATVIGRFVRLESALEDIKALSGSGPDAIGRILSGTAQIQKVAAGVVPPEEFRETHALFMSAVQLAERAARIRREAALTGDMDRAWNASSAAAGALMLGARARSDLQTALRLPQIPK